MARTNAHSLSPTPHTRLHEPQSPVFGLDIVGERFGLLVSVVVMPVVVPVAVVGGSDVIHLVNATTFRAPLYRALAGHLDEEIMVS